MILSRHLHPWVLGAILLGAALPAAGQIIVPDRMPSGDRMPVLTTSADRGTLAYDTVRTLPAEDGGRDTWWHRHALFTDGPVRMAMDPVVEYARQWRRLNGADNDAPTESGFRNIRGVRYRGTLDGTPTSGQGARNARVLVGPDTEYVLAAQGYPGMGPGKLRPAGNGLFGIDHSLAEVWFDVKLRGGFGCNGDWVRSAWDRERATCCGIRTWLPPHICWWIWTSDADGNTGGTRAANGPPRGSLQTVHGRGGMPRSAFPSAVWARPSRPANTPCM